MWLQQYDGHKAKSNGTSVQQWTCTGQQCAEGHSVACGVVMHKARSTGLTLLPRDLGSVCVCGAVLCCAVLCCGCGELSTRAMYMQGMRLHAPHCAGVYTPWQGVCRLSRRATHTGCVQGMCRLSRRATHTGCVQGMCRLSTCQMMSAALANHEGQPLRATGPSDASDPYRAAAGCLALTPAGVGLSLTRG
jgi:hypothetical protein